MENRHRLSITPGTALALVALFFALGGSAFAVGERIRGATVAQQRCANGAVRGVAVVTGTPTTGIANVPDRFTGAAGVFARRFNCTGKAVQVRRVAAGVFEVRFVGNAATSAVASAGEGFLASVGTVSAGTFRVSVHPAGLVDRSDVAFTIVAV